jgi:hypothetical protein
MVVLAIDRTGSAALAGVLLACSTLPQLVTGPVLGAALDRSRRPGAPLGAAVVLSAVAVGALAADRAFAVVAVLAALALALTQPVLTGGLSASFGRLAGGPADAGRIASWDSVAYNVAGLGGPALITVVAAIAGATTATVVLAVAILAALPTVLGGWPAGRPDKTTSTRATLRAALRTMVERAPLRAVTLTTTVSFLGIGGLTIAAAAAARGTGRDGAAAGEVVTAIALGALAGSVLWTRLRPPARPARTVTIATAATGLALVGMGAGGWPVVMVGAVIVGVLDAPLLIGTFVARHAESPLELRSSVFTVGASLKLAASSFGALVAGWTLGTAMTAIGLAAIGAVHLVAAALGWLAGRGAPVADESGPPGRHGAVMMES